MFSNASRANQTDGEQADNNDYERAVSRACDSLEEADHSAFVVITAARVGDGFDFELVEQADGERAEIAAKARIALLGAHLHVLSEMSDDLTPHDLASNVASLVERGELFEAERVE